MIATGTTWGISGPMFLLVYAVVAVAVTAAVVRARRALTAPPVERPVARLADRPYDVAYLNGGADLALCAALSAMHRRQTVATSGRGVVVAAGRPEPGTDELERAAHHAAVLPVPRRRLADAAAVASALDRIEARLVGGGLLLSRQQRGRMRATGGWTLAVAALGVARIVAGVANGRPVGFLVLLVVAVTAIGVVQIVWAPRRTRAGDAALKDLARDHAALSPSMRPDWGTYGPAGAALSVGVFGVGALWASDPAFAAELAAQRSAAAASSGGMHSSSAGSDSSCGGSGGGGGCGGGGCGG
jgi:uncharacterized protein (TIGR04222 family)